MSMARKKADERIQSLKLSRAEKARDERDQRAKQRWMGSMPEIKEAKEDEEINEEKILEEEMKKIIENPLVK